MLEFELLCIGHALSDIFSFFSRITTYNPQLNTIPTRPQRSRTINWDMERSPWKEVESITDKKYIEEDI